MRFRSVRATGSLATGIGPNRHDSACLGLEGIPPRGWHPGAMKPAVTNAREGDPGCAIPRSDLIDDRTPQSSGIAALGAVLRISDQTEATGGLRDGSLRHSPPTAAVSSTSRVPHLLTISYRHFVCCSERNGNCVPDQVRVDAGRIMAV